MQKPDIVWDCCTPAVKECCKACLTPPLGTNVRPNLAHTEAQFQLGLIYRHGTSGRRWPTSHDYWLRAATARNSDAAQKTLELLFPNGLVH